MVIEGWVAVGIFVAMSQGNPEVVVKATEDVYSTQEGCESQLKRIAKRVDERDDSDKQFNLQAYGASCVKVKVNEVAPKPNL